MFRIQEPFGDAGAHLFDAKTGEILWKKASVKAGGDGEGPGRGLALDIDPRYPGFECWVAGAGLQRQDVGLQRQPNRRCHAFGQYGRLLGRRLVERTCWMAPTSANGIGKTAKTNVLLDAKDFGCVSNNGTKANPVLSADILGDWREEVIWRTADNKELRIFSTTIPTNYRFRHVHARPDLSPGHRVAKRRLQPAAAHQFLPRPGDELEVKN